ncbi:hypothetical protein LCGC14_3025300 [marine sediment metagenome]|uniref:B box-type domain-containing protein n=1 Tax=marine sediment metagenome TaxID=412755 RepID=A0A0F8WUF6_9ZZZZ
MKTIIPPFWPCPKCNEENPVRDIPIEEADTLCLLCERESICRPCSKKLHQEGALLATYRTGP